MRRHHLAMRRAGLPPGRTVTRWAVVLCGVWPGLLQAQNLDNRKALSTLAPDPLQALHLSNYLIGIVSVFAVLAVASWLLRRYQPRVGRGLIRIESCLSLGGKEKLMVVQVQGRRLLLGVSSAGINLLRDLESAGDGAGTVNEAEVHSGVPGQVRAGNWLQQTLKSVVGS